MRRTCRAHKAGARAAWSGLWPLLLLQAGCAVLTPVETGPHVPPRSTPVPAAPATVAVTTPLRQVGWQMPGGGDDAPLRPGHLPPPRELKELTADAVAEQVLARSPTLAQMLAAWQAASARYPQVTSLDDPMFGATVGPASIGSRDVDFAYRVEASQKFPWKGKLDLRGKNADAEASAAGYDVADVKLQLVEAALAAFYDYYLAERALSVNEEGLDLLRKFRANAEERFRNRLAPEQDLRQADVEIGRQQERRLTLVRMRQVAVARINTLMHLPPDSPLPPPPEQIRVADEPPNGAALRTLALSRRPDLRALADRIEADRASLALAHKEYYPDFEVLAAYDAFWQRPEQDLRPMVGVRLNLPVRQARRAAAVAEAQARLARRQAELDRQVDQVNFEVQQAYEQVRESARAARLYERTILPAARENVKAALVAYTTNRVPFLSLIEAQRNLVNLRERSYETTADYFRRKAQLERAVGGPFPPITVIRPGPKGEKPGKDRKNGKEE